VITLIHIAYANVLFQ